MSPFADPARPRLPRSAAGLLSLACLSLLGAQPPTTGDSGPPPTADLSAPLWTPGVLDAEAGHPGRWRRELDRRQAILDDARGKDHRAALALLGLVPALGGELPRDELVAFVEGVRDDRKRHPLVRAVAADGRAQLHEDAGELEQAWKAYADNGRILSWQVAGPFDNGNRGGHGQAYGPEREAYEVGQSFADGKRVGEPVAWQAYEAENTLAGGYLSFDEFLRPNEYVTAYATTWIRAPKKTRAVLHMGTGGAHKVWVNEALVGEGTAYRRPTPWQEAYAVELDAGWNRVLVKVGCELGSWGLFARISDSKGAPLEGVQIVGSPAVAKGSLPVAAVNPKGLDVSIEEDPDADAESLRKKAPESLRKLFEAAAEKEAKWTQANKERLALPSGDGRQGADAVALTELYHWIAPFGADDFTARDAARAAHAASASTRSALFLALAEDDPARARQALEEGVARGRERLAGPGQRPGQPPSPEQAQHEAALVAQMLIELAYAYANLGMNRRAEALVDEAAQLAPDDALIELARLDELGQDGLALAALAWIEDLRGRYPHSATVMREHANRLFAVGRVVEGLAVLDQHSREHAGDASVIDQRIEAHLQLGEVQAAVGLARELAAGVRGRPAVWVRLAELEEAAGDPNLATAAMLEAVALAPSDAQLHAQLGFLRSRSGDQAGAIQALSRSLELNPQQPELRDLLDTLGASRDDVFTRYAVDTEALVEAYRGEGGEADSPPANWAGKEAAVLHRMIATRIDGSGLGERLDHRVIAILDDRGIEGQARHDFGYEPDESYVEVRRARVYRADGRVEDIGITRHYAVGSAGYRMYYDQRGVAVEFPGLRVGDVVEVAFVRRDVATRNKFDDYYGDLVPTFGGSGLEPTRHFEYLLEAPTNLALHFNQPAKTEVLDEGRTLHRVEVDDLAGLRPESSMPGWTELTDYLHVSSYATWDAVGEWYWGLVEGQLLVDDAIEAGVREALEPLPKAASELDKVAALYRHVIESTRYVGLEFGIHGYKPYRTTDIYNRRFGDCKDKASLLKVMLAQIGVDAHLVLVRTRDMGTIEAEPASLSAFNHAIVYVPKYDLYMDGTAEYSGAFELPAGDQGASAAIILDGKGARFTTIPYAAAQDNTGDYALSVQLRADGSAQVDQRMVLEGSGASSWRSGLEVAEQRDERLTQLLARTYPGVTLEQARYPGIDDILAPVEVEAKLRVPGFATGVGEGGTLRWRALGHEVQLVRSYAAQATREHPLDIGVPNRELRELKYAAPPGMRLTQVPKGATLEAPFARFELAVESASNGRSATLRSTLEFTAARIEVADYAAFRDFLAQVDAALAQTFEAAPTSTPR